MAQTKAKTKKANRGSSNASWLFGFNLPKLGSFGLGMLKPLAVGSARFLARSLRSRLVFLVMVIFVLVNMVVAVSAWEAHIINVTATIVQIDPPVITPPGGQYSTTIDINIDDDDPDATHIYYTLTPGTDDNLAIDPVCGGVNPGGPKPLGPITLLDDTVVKAIACDGDTPSAHFSLITTEIYDLTLTGKIEGRKYHDLDQSGTLTLGDTLIQGWRVDLRDDLNTSTLDTTVTDANGYYTFNNLIPADYRVIEEDRPGWIHVSPSDVLATISGSETDTVNFFNYDSGFQCVPEPISFPTDLAVQAAGFGVNDDIFLAANVEINGDARSNKDIEGSANDDIFGDAAAVGTVDPGINVTGTLTNGAALASLPLTPAQIDTWKDRAQDGGTVNGSFTFPNNTIGLVMGPTEIMGNVTFGSSNSVTIKGPLYIHGNLTIGSNSSIIQDPGFGNQFVTIVVGGTIDIDSNISFTGAGVSGAFLLISENTAVAGDDAAIATSANNSDLGDVVLYAANGDIHINSNRTLLAAFAMSGTGDDTDNNAAIRFDSNVEVNYRALPTTISCGPRQPYESTSHVLINEFMPNPVGDDIGSAGGALDGEWVELFNPTAGTVDVAGYVLYDSVNTNALTITTGNTNTGGTTIPSLGYLVVYREGDADFELNNSGGDTVRLFTGPIVPSGVLVDSHIYVRDAPENKSFARVPDGASNWVDPESTPGEPNNFSFMFGILQPLPGEIYVPAVESEDKPPLFTEVIIADLDPLPEPEEEVVVTDEGEGSGDGEGEIPPEEQVLGETTETGDGTQPEAGPPGAETPPADETQPAEEPASDGTTSTEPPVEETIPPTEETTQPEAGPPGAETPPAPEPPADEPPPEPTP